MKGGGDAVGDELPVGVAQRKRRVEADAGPRHDLAFETVAMDVDDAGQHEQAVGVDDLRAARPGVEAIRPSATWMSVAVRSLPASARPPLMVQSICFP